MISFVLLHYQAIEETLSCVETIKKFVKSEKKIVIVDNASPNKSGFELEKNYKNDEEVSVIITEKNLGFAQGNNVGYKEAKKHHPEFIVVMNNDVFLTQEDFVERIQNSYDTYRFDVLGPDIYSTRGELHQNPQRGENYTLEQLKTEHKKLVFKNRFKFLLRLKYLLKKNTGGTPRQSENYTDVQFNKPLHGAAYIFSKPFIEKYENCFYPKTFMYYESYILHYWGMKEGLSFVYDPTIKVLHHEDVSTDKTYSDLYKKVAFVNKCLLDSSKVFIDLMEDYEK
ncbi:glycosyltransferase [Streptococcus cameli]